MKAEKVIVERTFNTTADKVWGALTDVNEMKNWYFQLEEFEPKVGFKFDFMGGPTDGKQYLHLCEVTEVIDAKKLAYTWRYDNYPGNSLVCWELLEKGEETLLKVTHSGLETFEDIGEEFDKDSFNEGWNHFVHTALTDYLETDQ